MKIGDYCNFQRRIDRGLALLKGCCLWQQNLHFHVGGSGTEASDFLDVPISIFSLSGPFVCFSSRPFSSLLCVRSYSSAFHTQVSLVHCILDFLTMTFFYNIIYSPSSLRWWEQAVIYVPAALLMLMAKSISTIVPFLLWVAFMLSFIPFNCSFVFHPHILCLLLAACSPCTRPCTNNSMWWQIVCSA